MDSISPGPAHVTHRRVMRGRSSVISNRLGRTVAALVAGVAALALFVGQRSGSPENSANTPTDLVDHGTGGDAGLPNPWAAGDAAVARYLGGTGRSC
jgi:hypothetical protein